MVSSYLPELFGMYNRLAVMSRRHRLSEVRPIDEWTPESGVTSGYRDRGFTRIENTRIMRFRFAVYCGSYVVFAQVTAQGQSALAGDGED